MESLENIEKLFNEYRALLLELGKSTCKKVPLCAKCPINKECSRFRTELKNK